ncbi:MAG: hypothetical protein KGL74_10680 [Elusimicrobia bacterium]|nr:hypothetical protein [Elusimicrobiota bacterium]MDE2511575.1 hypothetical protein [Elusimicrobiota bacterium]
MQRKATAVWLGGLKDGKGRISAESRLLKDANYGFVSRSRLHGDGARSPASSTRRSTWR